MPQPVLDRIIEKADGVPLFIEELTSSMLSAPLRTRGTFERATQPGSLRVPDTLSDALMERLDRVAPSRRLAQIAAVIGREFSYDLLSAASQIDEDGMLSALSLLEQADIIYRVGISPVLRFAFKHALLRDAIYDSLLRSKRQQIHADIAAILERDFPSSPRINPKFWLITTKKQAITNWPFVAGSSLGRARSRIPPTSKRLLISEMPFSF